MINLNNIDCIYEISELKNKKIHLFNSDREKVHYSLITDGCLNHVETWLDKNPYNLDNFLLGCGLVKRYNFTLDYANVLVIYKKYKHNMQRILYVNKDMFEALNDEIFYEVSINSKDNIKVRRIGGI